MNRINIIALGVRDMERSRTFYRDGLGFSTPNNEENPQVVFFDNGGTKLEIYPIEGIAKNINETDPPKIAEGFAGITLAYNAKSKEEVDEIFAKIESVGGTIAKRPDNVFWGGYSGYFKDINGYYWEVAYWDGWKFDDNDMIVVE